MIKRYGFFAFLLAASMTSFAQFVVQKNDGSSHSIKGNVTFTKDLSSDNWAVGDVYDENLRLDKIHSISLTDEEFTDPFANKKCWVYGIKAPQFPGRENLQILNVSDWYNFPAGTWGRTNFPEMGMDNDKQFVTWSDTCGWFDCNKTYDIDDADDFNMCWAAAASNLVHWWLTQNADYIARYDEIYGQTYDYARPSAQFLPPLKNNLASNKSEVFKFFINTFANRAGWSASGVNWFVNGNSSKISAPFRNPSMATSFVGFFPEVFSKSDVIATDSKNVSKDNFNALMKQAFSENKAIGVVVYDIAGKNTGSHALTIWGAEFDEKGMVSCIYYVENNMPDQDPRGAAVYRYGISYYDDPNDYSNQEVTYFEDLPKPLGGAQNKYLVTALILVDLRRDVWEAAAAEWDAMQSTE